MAIIFQQKQNTITLHTKNTSYQMKVDSLGYVLHTWYGERIADGDDMSLRIRCLDRGFSGNPYETMDRSYSLDLLPQEYSMYGNGDFRNDCIQVIHEDGTNVMELKYCTHEILKGKYSLPGLPGFFWQENEGESLRLVLKDAVSQVQVELFYGVLEEEDLITRAVKVINPSPRNIILNKALSLCLDFLEGDFDFIHFYGKHNMEREWDRLPLGHGKQSIGSKRGTSSHHHNPFVILADKTATETQGRCYGTAFVYSGSFLCEAEVDQIGQTRLVMGIHPEQFSFLLKEGESCVLPEAVLSYSSQGFEKLTHNFHNAVRRHLLRGPFAHDYRPILINSWEAAYFDFDGERIYSIAKKAAALGIELLVMDDGWFGERYDDTKGLGDWQVNETKLGCSLSSLVERVNALGIKFGIWFEPEMINESSRLYQEHPDWMIRLPNRMGTKSREQYVLDFTRKDVRKGIEGMMRNILDSSHIEYVKWDMNRALDAVYSHQLPREQMGEFHHRFVLGLYEMLESLITSYPHILFEGCSSGGGRYDLGMFYYHPQIWCSDDTDAIERLKIQYGSSFAYPIGCAGAHVSASPNHQTHRRTPLETRGTVAMAGSFGYELDLDMLEPGEEEIIRHQIKEYKEYYNLVHEGDYYRLTSPYDANRCCAWEFLNKEKNQGLLCAVVQALDANPAPIVVYPRGLEPKAQYTINGQVLSGAAWMAGGVPLPWVQEEYQSFRMAIQKV